MEPHRDRNDVMGPPEGMDEEFNEEELRAQSDDLLELRYLKQDNAVFERTKGGFVALTYRGKHYDRIGTYRMFPVSTQEEYISIREADEKAREIGIIRKLDDLRAEEAEMIREQLRMRYFTPIVEKVSEVKEEYGYAYFTVQTNYGVCRFTTHLGSDAVLLLSDDKVQITDLDGNRYIIPDYYKLSVQEKKRMDLFI